MAITDSNNLWILGVAFCVVGSIVGTSGKQMIRFSELRKQRGQIKLAKSVFALGIGFQVVLNPICDLSGYAFAQASVIAPFTGMDIVWNTLIAPCTLGEALTPRRLFCALMVFLSATVSVFFQQEEKELTLERAEQIIWGPRFWCYALGFMGWYFLNVGVLMKRPEGSRLRGFSYGATAGTLAGNMWCTKVVATFAGQCITVGGDCTAWTSWVTWLILAGAIFFAISNLSYMARGMQQFEALFMVPVFQGSNIVANSVSAIVVLQEMDGATWSKLAGYWACIVIMVSSMIFLATGETSGNAILEPSTLVSTIVMRMSREPSAAGSLIHHRSEPAPEDLEK